MNLAEQLKHVADSANAPSLKLFKESQTYQGLLKAVRRAAQKGHYSLVMGREDIFGMEDQPMIDKALKSDGFDVSYSRLQYQITWG